MAKKRFAQVGLGGRARFFYNAVARTYGDSSELVGFCDINRTRMEYANDILERDFGYHRVPMYGADEFEKMILETKPDCVIVTTIDRTHHRYICKAMEMGCDVITEKPMTMDAKKAQQILDCVEKTGKNLRVSFNYRYAPYNTKLREVIMDGAIGDVKQIHFEWMLNYRHGGDYFRRWHRDKRNSGGLLVHKSTHHFDLVNFWIGSYPVRVFAMGDLKFYGRENAEERGITKFYDRGIHNPDVKTDPWSYDLTKSESARRLYLEAEKDDGYIRDQSVFGDNISIEDTMNVMVEYANGAQMCYSLNAYSPWEGFRIGITGTKGRVEMEVLENVYVNGDGSPSKEGAVKSAKITVYPLFEEAYNVPFETPEGGHGGGDPVLLADVFGKNKEQDRFHRAASHIDGALSIMTGICANKSIATGMPIKVLDEIYIPGYSRKR